MRFLIIFIFLLSNCYAKEIPNINNIVVNKEPKKYNSLIFLDAENNELKLDDFKGNIILLNF